MPRRFEKGQTVVVTGEAFYSPSKTHPEWSRLGEWLGFTGEVLGTIGTLVRVGLNGTEPDWWGSTGFVSFSEDEIQHARSEGDEPTAEAW